MGQARFEFALIRAIRVKPRSHFSHWCLFVFIRGLKNKKPTAVGQWVGPLRERINIDCRAGQQRVRKQQVYAGPTSRIATEIS